MSDPDRVEGQMPQPQPDFAAVVAEIEDEARRTRAAGDTPVELIERLDAEFDRFAPRSHHRTGVEGAIRSVEAAAFINVDAPTSHGNPVMAFVKRVVRKTTSFYHLHVARQVTALGIQMTRPLRMLHAATADLERRVAELERRATGSSAGPSLASDTRLVPSARLSEQVASAVANAVGGGDQRVFVTSDDVGTTTALHGAGIDAYDVTGLDDAGLDGAALNHLGDLATGTLGGVVLTGATDRWPAASRVELVWLALDRLRPGSRIVIAAADPDAWAADVGPVVADLSAGRPFHADTWIHLLEHFGARHPRVEASLDGHTVIVASAS